MKVINNKYIKIKFKFLKLKIKVFSIFIIFIISIAANTTPALSEFCWSVYVGEKAVDKDIKYDWSKGEVPGNCMQIYRGGSVTCDPKGFYCKPELTLKKGGGIPYASCSGSCITWTKMEYKYDVYQKYYQKYCFCPKTGPYKVGDPYPGGDKEKRLADGYPKSKGTLIQKEKPGQDPLFLIPSIPMCGFISPNSSTKHKIFVDRTVSGLTIFIQWLNNSSYLNTVLYSPNGSRIDPLHSLNSTIDDYARGTGYEYYTLNLPEFGIWTIEIIGSNISAREDIYSILFDPISDLVFSLYTNKEYYLPKEQVTIIGRLAYNEKPIRGALVIADIVRPDNITDKITLFDKGPQDGNYSAIYKNIDQEGIYSISAIAKGTTINGDSFQIGDGLTVRTPSSKFSGDYFDKISNMSNNLTIDVGIDIIVDEIYYIQGKLCDADGNKIAISSNNTRLSTAHQIAKLDFMGRDIWRSGIDGMYYLTDLYLFDKNWILLDYIRDAHITSMYDHYDFQPPLAGFTGIYSDKGVDIDKDGLYDYLTIDVGIDTIKPGNYSINGYLEDVNGSKISWSIGSGSLSIGNHTMHLDFDGDSIKRSDINGPYKLAFLTLLSGSRDTNITACDAALEPYITSVYKSSDFEDHANIIEDIV